MDKRADISEDFSISTLLSDLKVFTDVKTENMLFNKIKQSEKEIHSALTSKLSQKKEELNCELTRFHNEQQAHHPGEQGNQ